MKHPVDYDYVVKENDKLQNALAYSVSIQKKVLQLLSMF
jgi:hypothetical protein